MMYPVYANIGDVPVCMVKELFSEVLGFKSSNGQVLAIIGLLDVYEPLNGEQILMLKKSFSNEFADNNLFTKARGVSF